MTTPGGVPNLPQGALTLSNLASATQDTTPSGVRGRANARMPSIFGSSTGGSIISDLSPFGIITAIFSGFNSVVANADPADVTGPQDLPALLIDFISSLPFVGQFVDILEAILGNYTGTDTTLLAVQAIFAPIQLLLQLITGTSSGFPTTGQITSGWANIPLIGPLVTALTGSTGTLTNLGNFFNLSNTTNFLSSLTNGVVGGSGNPFSSLLSSLTGTASTASTANSNASTALGNFTSLFAGLPGVSSIANLISFLVPGTGSNGIFSTLINGVSGGTTNPLSSLISSLTGTASTASTASTNSTTNGTNITSLISNLFGGGSILSSVQASAVPTLADAKLPGLGTLIDDLFGGFIGTTSSGATQANVGAATASQTDTVGGQGALIAQIQAALGAGTPDSDDFERSSLGANWTFLSTTGTGTIPDSHNFHFSGTGTADYVMRKNNLAGTTDHITSTVVLNQTIPAYLLFTPLPFGGNIRVWVRQTAFTTYATRSGVYFEISSNGYAGAWRLVNVVSGTETALTSGSCAIPASGAIVSLESGASATPRRYLGTLNGTTVCDFTDSGSVTTIGSSNRYRGFGGKGGSGVGTAQGTPDLRQWTAAG